MFVKGANSIKWDKKTKQQVFFCIWLISCYMHPNNLNDSYQKIVLLMTVVCFSTSTEREQLYESLNKRKRNKIFEFQGHKLLIV